MTNEFKYRFPVKLKKFNIDDPFLNIVVAKYENEIPWQTKVRDAESLILFINEHMLPNILKKIEWPLESGSKHYYITHKNVDLNRALTTDQELNREEIERIKICLKEDGEYMATQMLVDVINSNKFESFNKWASLMQKKYSEFPAFQLLLLRPLFESSGFGSRRAIISPSEDIVNWIFSRIQKGRINPNHNIAKEYFIKNAFGTNKSFKDGWQFIPEGSKNASKLSAACQGSGWCVASAEWARSYLMESSFYILRSEGIPVVALRTYRNRIVECQGRNNMSPYEWFADVHIFMKTKEFMISHRVDEYNNAISQFDIDTAPVDWWNERIKYCPSAYGFAPDAIKKKLNKPSLDDLYIHIGVFSFDQISKNVDNKFTTDDYIQILKIRPELYVVIPNDLVENQSEQLNEACILGWVEKIEDKQLTTSEIEEIPVFVKNTERFIKSLTENLPDDLEKKITRRPQSAEDRYHRFNMEDILPASQNEPFDIAVKRALNILICNETSDFSNSIFPKELRNHELFSEIRQNAWIEAIKDNPTYIFALPEDLKNSDEFSFTQTKASSEALKKWCKNVRSKPWILTQKNAVPKSVRYHNDILKAYIEGWIPHLISKPWQIWVLTNKMYGKRSYLSYPALRNVQIINALIEGFYKYFEYANCWRYASFRMRSIPAMQFAFLIAAFERKTTLSVKLSIPILPDRVYDLKNEDAYLHYIHMMQNNKFNEVYKLYFEKKNYSKFNMSNVKIDGYQFVNIKNIFTPIDNAPEISTKEDFVQTKVEHIRNPREIPDPTEYYNSNTRKSDSDIQENSTVEHEVYGTGKVMGFKTSDQGKSVVVIFEKHGEKNLLLRLAKLKLIEP